MANQGGGIVNTQISPGEDANPKGEEEDDDMTDWSATDTEDEAEAATTGRTEVKRKKTPITKAEKAKRQDAAKATGTT